MAQQPGAPATKKKTSVPQFVGEVRAETRKVVWPTREETVRTAIFVFIMMVLLSLFFLGIDTAFQFVVNYLLTLA
jgi:preprotein translocase subunit SecE